MMQTLTAPVWLWAVPGVLAVVGFVAVCWVAAGWAERAADWWRGRRQGPVGEYGEDDGWACDAEAPDEDHCWFDLGHDGLHSWEQRAGLGLPPERTWEQMTSHQFPLDAELKRLGLPPDHDWDPGCRVRGCPVHGNWEEAQERRAPWWEAEHQQAYEALGFDYPSGLVARVRELAP